MQVLLALKQRVGQKIVTLTLATLVVCLALLVGLSQPSYAAQDPAYQPLTPQDAGYKPLTPEEKIDRAYDIRQGVGMEEEEFQERLQKGENPEKMAEPYKRVKGAEGQEVPESSLLEEAVGKVKEILQ